MTREEQDAINIQIGQDLESMIQTRGWKHILSYLDKESQDGYEQISHLQINAELLGTVAHALGQIKALREIKDFVEMKIRDGKRLGMVLTVKAGH